jgi:hypothetical protein
VPTVVTFDDASLRLSPCKTPLALRPICNHYALAVIADEIKPSHAVRGSEGGMPTPMPPQLKWLEASSYSGNAMFPGVAATAARELLRCARCCLAVLALVVAPAQTGWAQEVLGVACITKADTGRLFAMREFPGGGMLIRAEKGWFLARMENGAVTVDRSSDAGTGPLVALFDFPGGGC